MNIILNELATRLDGQLLGDGGTIISGLSSIDNIQAGHLVFAENERYLAMAENSNAAAIMLPLSMTTTAKPALQVTSPLASFGALLPYFYPPLERERRIHPSAVIDDTAVIAANCHIGPNAVIGANSKVGKYSVIEAGSVIGQQVTIGAHCHIYPNVTIYDQCLIGDQVRIHANTVIGSDGFGYIFDGEKHQKIPHVGHVEIGKNVEIGANTVIDKATLGATQIGEGTKIDNLVQVAHNVSLGKHNVLCAFTGIAGSSRSGNNVVFAANVGVADHVTIEDNVVLGARAGIPPKKTIPAGSCWLGSPAKPEKKAIEQMMVAQRLPSLRKTIQSLQKRVSELEK